MFTLKSYKFKQTYLEQYLFFSEYRMGVLIYILNLKL